MKSATVFPSETTHPETGERMVLDTTQGSDVLEPRLTRDVAIASGGEQVLGRIREKEQQEGRIYVNPATGYRARLKPPAASAGGDATTDQSRWPGGTPYGTLTPEQRTAKAEELRWQLAQLEAP